MTILTNDEIKIVLITKNEDLPKEILDKLIKIKEENQNKIV